MTDIEEYEEEDYESDLKKELFAKTELKPCPFCGSKSVALIIDLMPINHKHDWWSVQCQTCSAEYRNIFCDKDEVIKGWNKRA